jgi:hypothetical protein
MFRIIDCNIWSDKIFETFAADERLIWIYLFTNPLTLMSGLYEITIKRIAYETALSTDIVTTILQGFERRGLIKYDGEELLVINFIKHQASPSPKVAEGITKTLAKAKNKAFIEIVKKKFAEFFGYPIHTLSIPYPENYPKSTKTKTKTNTNTKKIKEPKKFEISEKTIKGAPTFKMKKEKSKDEWLKENVEALEKNLFPVTNKKKLESLIKTHGGESIAAAIERCILYFASVQKNKWKEYVFAKRFSKFIENINSFLSAEAFDERMRLMAKWNTLGAARGGPTAIRPNEPDKPITQKDRVNALREMVKQTEASIRSFQQKVEAMLNTELDTLAQRDLMRFKENVKNGAIELENLKKQLAIAEDKLKQEEK